MLSEAAGQPARVPGSVQPLVVAGGDRRGCGPAPVTRASIRSVRYGCSRTRSSSASVSRPGLSQMALDTPRRPRSWIRPGPAERGDLVGAADRRSGPPPPARCGHAAGVPGQNAVTSGRRGRPSPASTASRSAPADARRQARLERQDRRPSSRPRPSRPAAARRAVGTGRRRPGRTACRDVAGSSRRAASTPCRRLKTSTGPASWTSRAGRQIAVAVADGRARRLPSHCS